MGYVINLKKHNNKNEVRYMCPPLDKIKGLSANELLQKFYPSNEYPLDLGVLLKNIGISNKEMDFSDLEEITKAPILGLMLSDNTNAAIYFRKGDTLNRQRFTIAHELAHCCLHYTHDENYRHLELRLADSANNPHETEADIFAGELLIPLSKLKEVYLSLDCPCSAILASKFGVSINVMEARLNYLEISYFNKNMEPVLNG
jgi:Zn-dependent peptidase ImmA (M78 family)